MLRDTGREILELIGADAMLDLSRHSGCRLRYIPKRARADDWLSVALADHPDEATAFRQRFRGEILYIPRVKGLEVLMLHRQGRSSSEIADLMGIADSTVSYHLTKPLSAPLRRALAA